MAKKKEPPQPHEVIREAVEQFREGVIKKDKGSRETNSGSAPTNGYAKGDSENRYR